MLANVAYWDSVTSNSILLIHVPSKFFAYICHDSHNRILEPNHHHHSYLPPVVLANTMVDQAFAMRKYPDVNERSLPGLRQSLSFPGNSFPGQEHFLQSHCIMNY